MSLSTIALLTFALGGLGTYLMRASFLALLTNVDLPPVMRRPLKYVAPAVFAAFAFPRFLSNRGIGALTERPQAELLAGLVAGLVGWRTRQIGATVVSGMVALWVLRTIL